MRFAIATADVFEGVLHSFLAAGWEPLKLFTYPLNGRCQGDRVLADAERLRLPAQLSRLLPSDLEALAAQGCQALVVASYPWRISGWQGHLPYAINFHPSPLPLGRGPWPLVRAIHDGLTRWGVSCHKLAPGFDEGELLAQERFALGPEETHESLELRCQMALRRLSFSVAQGLPALWDGAVAQGEGSYFHRGTQEERLLSCESPVSAILSHLRAYGMTESTVRVNGLTFYVRRAVAWEEAHGHAPGTIVHRFGRRLVLAAKDGYVGLLEWSVVPPEGAGELGR